MSSGIPHANIAATGPLTRGDFLMLLYWNADTRAVPHVRGIAGLARLPQINLPLAKLGGCPLGLSLVAARGGDTLLLELARRIGLEN